MRLRIAAKELEGGEELTPLQLANSIEPFQIDWSCVNDVVVSGSGHSFEKLSRYGTAYTLPNASNLYVII